MAGDTCGAFLCEGFSGAFYVCEDCRAANDGGDFAPGPQRSTPQIPVAETLRGTEGADTLPEAAPEPEPEILVSADALADLRGAFMEGQRGALREALELARADARDVEDVEILMLVA